MNNVVLIGRLTRDPEMSYIPSSGTPVARFTLAIDRDYKKKDGTRDTDFIPVEVMGITAENCGKYISKGRLVAVQGSIRVDNYETKEGERRVFTKVSARNVQFLESRNAAPVSPSSTEAAPDNGPSFSPQNYSADGFEAISDDDMPF